MHATELIFPLPATITPLPGRLALPKKIMLGAVVPPWLRARVGRACAAAGVKLAPAADVAIRLRVDGKAFPELADAALRAQAYELTLAVDGGVLIQSPGAAGLQYGLITLCHLLEAAAGARLTPLRILDRPAYRLRAVQIDLARQFYAPPDYLKKCIDRLADLKVNTLWLYLENHFRAPGLEHLSPDGSMTPAQARDLSRYAAERGIDLVPGTNLSCHMEGFLRLERYADHTDGRMRSYPVMDHREIMDLMKRYADAMAAAFPSPNFHAGLDEYLFTGTNPEAAALLAREGKARLFGRYCREIIRHLESRGKTVWYWDDMVMGKNIHRPEGFNEDYPKALALFPRSAIATHWYYWTDADGKHSPVLERVRKAGRPFVMASGLRAWAFNCFNFGVAMANAEYMAQAGGPAGAFGYVCTQWEADRGSCFEAQWPLMAASAQQGWSGGRAMDAGALRALSFALTGDRTGAVGGFVRAIDDIENFLLKKSVGNKLRDHLFCGNPYKMWRACSPLLSPADRAAVRRQLAAAERSRVRLGARDAGLKEALRFPVRLLAEMINLLDAFDAAWTEYHRAALAQAGGRSISGPISRVIDRLGEVLARCRAIERELRAVESTGHAPYDAIALRRHRAALGGVIPMVRALARRNEPLPYFEKLFYLPDSYQVSNLDQLRLVNSFFERNPGQPWPKRWRE
jgi:hypothetical protein